MDDESTGRIDHIDEIVAGFLDAAERGEAVDAEALFRRHPEIEVPLRARLKTLGNLNACLGQLRALPQAEGIPAPSIKGYRILERLGQGGMGAVFLAEQESLKRLVAVKVLSALGTGDARSAERFRREAETIARLAHPGIVAIHEFGAENGTLYLTLDLAPGLDLAGVIAGLRESDVPPSGAEIRRRIIENGRKLAALAAKHGARVSLPKIDEEFWARPYADICAAVVMDVAEALDFAHSRGVMHRDVKPSNVILDVDGSSRLIDFGLTLSESASALTRPTDFIGSAPYCSPEQVNGNVRVGHASEVFSLGGTLYEMLSLRRPFDGSTVSEILSRVARAKPEPLSRVAAGIPPELQDICGMAMAKDPGSRYATAGAMAVDLRRYLNGESVRARSAAKYRHAGAAASVMMLVIGGALWSRRAVAPPVRVPVELPAAAPRTIAVPVHVAPRREAPPAAVPPPSEKYRVQGLAMLQAKRYAEGVQALAKAVELSPEDSKIRLSYAEALRLFGDFDAAEKQYALCVTQNPRSTQALQGYGAVLAHRGDLSGAVRQYKKSLDLSSVDAHAHLLVAALLSDLQRDEEAVYYYTKAEALATSAEDRAAAREGLARLTKTR